MENKNAQYSSVYRAREIWTDPGQPRIFAPAGINTFAVMLGSGKPEPTPHRYGPGGAVIANQTPYLIDAGDGIWRAVANAAIAHNEMMINALSPNNLTRLFITHLHSDHAAGLPSLILLPWIHGRTRPIEIYGPIGVKNLVESLLEADQADIEERVHGPEQKDDIGWRATAHEIAQPGLVYSDENMKIEAFHHPHGGFKQNFGYRFSNNERIIIWAGDGIESDSYLEAARDADILFSDASPVNNELVDTPWRGDQKNIAKIFHMQSRRLAEFASQANVKTVVLHHEQNYSEPYDPDILVNEVKQYFSGEVVSARDGDVF
ncbi:MAG: MBL fold metallo-hydrolase [Anaerolineaceae bacterium]|nr:MBL fold metallo-hydrolase [Anaerolineaceae bacterium]